MMDKMDKTIAHELAKKQKEISVAEFFEKNRHLLGFDNKRKALLTVVKEAVDNSLDACEEARILPEIIVEITEMGEERFRVVVEDNGPGIIKQQIPKIFATLLYGSKFHNLQQNRGQQGIGISAAVLYAQLTTGRPTKITSKIGLGYKAEYCELHIDTQRNMPEVIKEESIDWQKERGTRVEMDIEAVYLKGMQSVDEYLKQTAIINPHVTIIYTTPKAEQVIYQRATDQLPPHPKEIKPHPHGVELGRLYRMLMRGEAKTLHSFLTSEFSKVGDGTAKEICENSALPPKTAPRTMSRHQAESLHSGIMKTKILAPPTDCISPLGEESVEKGLRKEINAEFYCSTTRSPQVYRGNPFCIECGIAYGGELDKEGAVTILRFANRVPLLYQQGACAITESIAKTNWRAYSMQQSGSSLPIGPLVVLVHMVSVWVPFTSEAKEALAHYPEIMKEIKLALQDCGRKLGSYINKKYRVAAELKKRDYIEKYIPHISAALKEIMGEKGFDEERIRSLLKTILETHRGEIEKVEMDNPDYDEDYALSKESDEEDDNS